MTNPTIYPRQQHGLSNADIDIDALKVITRLQRQGFDAYLVGGGVRDILLKRRPKDFDVATNATPRRIKSLFSASRIIGRRFKLVHVYFQGSKIIEVSTFRDASSQQEVEGEEETAQNNASNSATSLLVNDNEYGSEETDAIRRDLTINALFYDPDKGQIIDYVGGMNDLHDKIIRVIGDPDVRFAEDPVRLLRVVRHAVRSGFTIEANCYEALIRNKKLIHQSPTARVYDEIRKDLLSGRVLAFLRMLKEVGLLSELMPELPDYRLLGDSMLTETLERVDDLASQGLLKSAFLPLAILTLFAASESRVNDDSFDNSDDVNPQEELQDQGEVKPRSQPLKSRSLDSSSRDNREDGFLYWDTVEDLEYRTQRAFKKLAITRKESELVQRALIIWHLLSEGQSPRGFVSGISQEDLYHVDLLLRVLPLNPKDKTAIRTLEKFKQGTLSSDGYKDQDGEPRKKTRRRRRTRSRSGGRSSKGANAAALA